MEFVVLASFMLLVILGFFAITSSKVLEAKEEGNKKIAQDIAEVVSNEIELAKSVNDGYTRVFIMPSTVNGVDYSIKIVDNRELIVDYLGYEYVKFLPSGVTGNIDKGSNKISKSNGVITIKWQESVIGKYSGFFGFPERFFEESIVSRGQMVKVTDAQYLSLKMMHNGIKPYDFTKITYDPPVFGATRPDGIALGDFAFPSLNNGHPYWEVMAHEQGHNFFGGTSAFYGKLAFGYPFLQESFAVLSAFYTYHYILKNQQVFGIDTSTINSLNYDFVKGRNYQESKFNEYISKGKPFNINDVLTSQVLDYKMIVYGETYGWQNYEKFTKAFENGISTRFTFQNDGVSDVEQSTYVIAALSASFDRDFRQDFKDLNFPIDEILYEEVYPKIKDYLPKSKFFMKNSVSNVISFADDGNVVLKGTLTQNTVPTNTVDDEFIVKDRNGNNVVILNLVTGNMVIKGNLQENQQLLLPSISGSDFVVKSSSGGIISYIDESGNFLLKGTLTQNGNP